MYETPGGGAEHSTHSDRSNGDVDCVSRREKFLSLLCRKGRGAQEGVRRWRALMYIPGTDARRDGK